MGATANSLAVLLLAESLRWEVVPGFKPQGAHDKAALLGKFPKPAVAGPQWDEA